MVVSLKESCLRILTAHCGGLVEVGNCPYRLIRPVLFACQPEQLAYIEDQSPHLMLDSDEIWALHLSRDFPNEPVTPPVVRASSLEPLEQGLDSDCPREVDLPPNRITYFKTRLAKEEALASASARLRERFQATRSDQQKRRAIFTGLTDYGSGSKKKKLNGSKSWGSHTPAGKTLAEKARQQVKKSAAVYANAVRAKASPVNPTYDPRPAVRTSLPSRPVNTPIFSIRRPLGKTPAPKCVVRGSVAAPAADTTIRVVQIPSTFPPVTGNPDAVKPTPFPKPKPLCQPKPIPLTTPLKKMTRPSINPQVPPPPPPTAVLLKAKATTQTSSSSTSSGSKKTSSLFMPKKSKPPPPQPSKSLVSRNGSSSR